MDIWYTKRNSEGVAILPGFFEVTYMCRYPLTKEMHDFMVAYLEPAVHSFVDDMAKSLEWV